MHNYVILKFHPTIRLHEFCFETLARSYCFHLGGYYFDGGYQFNRGTFVIRLLQTFYNCISKAWPVWREGVGRELASLT